MKWALSFLLMLVVSATALGQISGPRIKFDTTTIDLGELGQGSNVEFIFAFTNIGDEPLILTSVKSSCGCLSPSWSTNPILPGERGFVKGKYDSNRIGGCHKSMTVQSNDSTAGTIDLYVKCIIHPKTPEDPTFILDKEFWQSDLVHQAGSIALNELGEQVIKIRFKNGGMSELTILNVVGNSGLKVLGWTTTPVEFAWTGQIKVAIPKRIGTFSYSIAVTTNHPTLPLVYVRVEGILVDGE